MTNSYMLPHGTRCSAIPRVTMPSTCVPSPTTVRPSAARIHGPAGKPPARHRLGGITAGVPTALPPPVWSGTTASPPLVVPPGRAGAPDTAWAATPAPTATLACSAAATSCASGAAPATRGAARRP